MANLIRSAKSGSDWTQHELRAYNIQMVEQSLVEFFNQNQLPRPFVRPRGECSLPTTVPTSYCTTLISHKIPRSARKPLLTTSWPDCWRRWGTRQAAAVIVTHQALSFIICGTQCSAQTDVCICDANDYLLLVQVEDKQLEIPTEPQLIAACQQNNLIRDRVLHIPILNEITFAGITLVGTSPTFHKIKITTEFNDAVM
ncbi:hypothetical protein J3R82DRAFT_1906 [Butyriboletus roseoflavus]|nr:hypothetical protein J3R82DRAFT_1906 [Butyriboletus roseoflavus]